MKIINEEGKFYKIIEQKEEINIEEILKDNEELKNKISGDGNSGYGNSGNWNSGNWNSGNWNSGNRNSGYGNSGNWNSGNWNSGNWNSGNRNSGNRNSGNWNSGNRNSGYGNSGNWNSGNGNSGNWNSGNWNSGYFSSITPNATFFGKESNIKIGDYSFPSFFFFELNTWIYADYMSDKEKKEFPTYETTGGYLKKIDYKTAWRNSWNKAELSERKKVLELPNWDNKMFLEITGIDVEKELSNE